MSTNTQYCSGRRNFLKGILPAGAMVCLGSNPILAKASGGEDPSEPSPEHKFLEKSDMDFQETFAFAYKIYMIPLLKKMAEDIGREKLIESLKSYATEVTFVQQTTEMWRSLLTSVFWTHVLTREIIEDSELNLKYNVTECLWAKTFREAEAGDIGFALFCYPDFARAIVADRKLTRTKTLMQGAEFCDFHFELDEKPDTIK